MKSYRVVDSISWIAHPTAQNVRIKPMISQKEHELDVTCMLVDIPAGTDVPEHIHDLQDDILYPLQGKAVMWVDGGENFVLEPGVIVKVPKGVKHKIMDVTESLLIYNVFCPALI